MCCGSVPIYLGAPDVENYLPKGTFIDYRGMTPEELYDLLLNMPDKERTRYRERIRTFITSDESDIFSSVTFAHKVVSVIEEAQ
jgi:hypothetical protein